MQHPDQIHDGATCEALDFHPFGPDRPPTQLPNVSAMGIVTLDEDGTFVSSRVFTEAELEAAWAEHRARHPERFPVDSDRPDLMPRVL